MKKIISTCISAILLLATILLAAWSASATMYQGNGHVLYDEFEDSSVNLNRWNYTTGTGTTIGENTEYIQLTSSNLGAASGFGTLNSTNITDINAVTSLNISVEMNTNNGVNAAGTAKLNIFGKEMISISSSGGISTPQSSNHNITISRNSTNSSYFDYYFEGVLQGSFLPTTNKVSAYTQASGGTTPDTTGTGTIKIFYVRYFARGNVEISSPANNSISTSLSPSIMCIAYGNTGKTIKNVSLWLNTNGTWMLNATNDTSALNPVSSTSTFSASFADASNPQISCQACDNDNSCAFSYDNRTLRIRTEPNITINSPGASVAALSFPVQVNISNSTALSYCYFNITRSTGVIEVTSTAIPDCMNVSTSVSANANYIINIWANTTDNVAGFKTMNFTVCAGCSPGISSGGGGGGFIASLVSNPDRTQSICTPFQQRFDEVWKKTEGQRFKAESINQLWSVFWDYAFCKSAASIVPI